MIQVFQFFKCCINESVINHSDSTDHLIIINFAELKSQNYFSHAKVSKGKNQQTRKG